MLTTLRRRTRVAIGFAVGVTLAVAGYSVLVVTKTPSSNPTHNSFQPGLIDPNAPLGPAGIATTLSGALAGSPVPLYRPQTSIASDESIVGIWMRPLETPELFIRYQSGIEESVRPADFSQGFDQFYRNEIAQGYPGSLLTIDGQEVFITPEDDQGELAGGDMVLGGMLVEIVGKGDFTSEQIETVAKSIIDLQSSTPSS